MTKPSSNFPIIQVAYTFQEVCHDEVVPSCCADIHFLVNESSHDEGYFVFGMFKERVSFAAGGICT